MIEELRYLLKTDPSLYLARVKEVSDLDADRSEYLVLMDILPDRGQVIAPQAFDDEKLQAGDVVLLAIPADEPEYSYVIAVLPNTSNVIHSRTDDGHRVIESRPGKKLNLVSNDRINIGKGSTTEEAEPLILGAILTTYLNSLMTRLDSLCAQIKTAATDTKTSLDAIKIGPVTAVTASPGNPSPTSPTIIAACTTAVASLTAVISAVDGIKSGLSSDKSTYLTDASSNIKSQIAFTERGGS